jgi:Ca2+:H+ antiporter
MAAIQGGPLPTNAHIMKELVLDPLNLLLVFAPFGVFGEFHDWPRGLTFLFCFLALVPLAKLLGDATEHLAENLNQTVGGLLNATFGNAVEMIITLNAIKANALDIVKSSLLGSILSNLLLVLGMAFFAGGLSKREQRFSGAAALINITMLLVGVMSFSLPTVFSLSNKEEMASLEVSRVSALFVSVGYIAYLVFQLHTHVEIFEDDSDAGQDDAEGAFTCVPLSPLPSPDLSPEACETELPRLESGASVAEALPATPGLGFGGVSMEAEDGVLSVSWALALLMASTVAVALLSEIMVDSIDGMVQSWRVPRSFVGVILLPIVGNACEHWSAVRMAPTEQGRAITSDKEKTMAVWRRYSHRHRRRLQHPDRHVRYAVRGAGRLDDWEAVGSEPRRHRPRRHVSVRAGGLLHSDGRQVQLAGGLLAHPRLLFGGRALLAH